MFEFTELDKEKVFEGYFLSQEPLRLRLLPKKQKKQYIILKIIVSSIKPNRDYSEKELNDILKTICPDFVSIRRGLIDYQLMARTADGKKYWVK